MARKKTKPTAAQIHEASEFAKAASGYTSASIIWNKRMPEVVNMMEVCIDTNDIGGLRAIIEALKARIAKNAIYNSQTH